MTIKLCHHDDGELIRLMLQLEAENGVTGILETIFRRLLAIQERER
ncbi:MAG: hypothetical protein UY32_C0029G0002 [Candidatus Jorgensenbacteria bacterium GW2011_GWC1_48_8]|uniref:Uncharacterized protein n=1 Tax=Candidatus Jorgensenbacteria bacterium GW2011_GWC1_48_8 TaxID=1618666 RepID=A0A0G1XVC2_9BACT|nr:MAG: hypothetical protein UY32_C0029G0002 [Candidatus Jorgensenbacteria bacterium GW2011_GWC1_48_8]